MAWKIRLLVVALGGGDKSDDVGAHRHSSKTAIAISPTSASDIRYAVIGSSPKNKMCGMTAASSHFGREPYPCPRGRVRSWTCSATPRAGAFARAG